jgi:hypothetical protein
MKMLMIIVDEAKREELEVFLDRSGLEGYTEVSHAAGLGTSGLRLGSSAYPKTSAIVFSILTEEALSNLNAGVDEFCASCGEELRMIAWDVDVLR